MEQLGDRYQRFQSSLVEYVIRPPFDRKKVVIAGLSLNGKSQLAGEILKVLESYPYELGYLKSGDFLEASRRADLVTAPLGRVTGEEYTASSANAVRIAALADEIFPKSQSRLDIYELVGTTAFPHDGQVRGSNRWLDLALWAVDRGALVVVMSATDEIIEKAFPVRLKILQASLDHVEAVLAEEDIVDDRSAAEIKAFYARSGNWTVWQQQKKDQYSLMYDLVRSRIIPPPNFDLTSPESFREKPRDTYQFVTCVYYKKWLEAVFQQANPGRGFVISNDVLLQGTPICTHGKLLEKARVLPQLDELTKGPKREKDRLALSQYGAINP